MPLVTEDPRLQPTGIDLGDSKGVFTVGWAEGDPSEIGYRALRLACRCAICIDELTGKALLDPSSVPDDVGVRDCRQIGLYGVQLTWTDGHSTGIYTWERLRELGEA